MNRLYDVSEGMPIIRHYKEGIDRFLREAPNALDFMLLISWVLLDIRIYVHLSIREGQKLILVLLEACVLLVL